jgi:predicted transcriptional regulator
MKSATIPSIRVAPELREAAEQLLEEGESLSSFAEQSLRLNIARRRAQKSFVERGLAARTAARQNNEYFEADDVLAELDELISDADERDPERLIK